MAIKTQDIINANSQNLTYSDFLTDLANELILYRPISNQIDDRRSHYKELCASIEKFAIVHEEFPHRILIAIQQDKCKDRDSREFKNNYHDYFQNLQELELLVKQNVIKRYHSKDMHRHIVRVVAFGYKMKHDKDYIEAAKKMIQKASTQSLRYYKFNFGVELSPSLEKQSILSSIIVVVSICDNPLSSKNPKDKQKIKDYADMQSAVKKSILSVLPYLDLKDWDLNSSFANSITNFVVTKLSKQKTQKM